MSIDPGSAALGEGFERVRAALSAAGLADRITIFDRPTKTSAEAAAALGCTVAQIAKSIVFKGADDRLVLVIASGANRVCETKVSALEQGPIFKADAAFVRAKTGFVIGGVSPIASLTPVAPWLDSDLLALPVFWAAAGHPNTVVRLHAAELLRLSSGTPADIALRGA